MDRKALPLTRLSAYLQERELLHNLDNFEHVLPAAGDVASLLELLPAVKVMTSSRAPLSLRGETRPVAEHLRATAEGGRALGRVPRALLDLECSSAQCDAGGVESAAPQALEVSEGLVALTGRLGQPSVAGTIHLEPPTAMIPRSGRFASPDTCWFERLRLGVRHTLITKAAGSGCECCESWR